MRSVLQTVAQCAAHKTPSVIMTTATIPIVDLSRPREHVLRQWHDAFATNGFAIVTGHGVARATVADLYASARAFFEGNAPDAKMAFAHDGDAYGPPGYTPVGGEAVAGKGHGADPVESLVLHHGGSPPDRVPASIREATLPYWTAMHTLLSNIMSISASALRLPESYFQDFYNPAHCSLRLAYYAAGREANRDRYGPHTDYTGFTILCRDEVPGLEVLINGEWVPVPFVPDSFVVNAGDLIQRWTNDVWKSNVHRVAPVAASRSRLSMVFFTGPRHDAVITPLECCCSTDNPPRYDPITAGEHLQRKLAASNPSK
ncbi:Fe2OG dioxygenase domain-containing protein [Plasmodiophora brassicae]|uniref:Fe2OG dioxygenase domain-containing protein n=1 Tax=Plasmodiophora brassicae TaxID=37360 RepID=A0A0G4IST9_PLABS|nr:hypothetical protein PBRA_006275 [Plasmodiophora brassicae]SPQ96018.1 unnamed protein product [Plasmodiophora brassicae]